MAVKKELQNYYKNKPKFVIKETKLEQIFQKLSIIKPKPLSNSVKLTIQCLQFFIENYKNGILIKDVRLDHEYSKYLLNGTNSPRDLFK